MATTLVFTGCAVVGSIEGLGISRSGAGNDGRGTVSVDQSDNRVEAVEPAVVDCPLVEVVNSVGFGTLGTTA